MIEVKKKNGKKPYIGMMSATSLTNIVLNSHPAVLAWSMIADVAALAGFYHAGAKTEEEEHHKKYQRLKSSNQEMENRRLLNLSDESDHIDDKTHSWTEGLKNSGRKAYEFAYNNAVELYILGMAAGFGYYAGTHLEPSVASKLMILGTTLGAKLCAGGLAYMNGSEKQRRSNPDFAPLENRNEWLRAIAKRSNRI